MMLLYRFVEATLHSPANHHLDLHHHLLRFDVAAAGTTPKLFRTSGAGAILTACVEIAVDFNFWLRFQARR